MKTTFRLGMFIIVLCLSTFLAGRATINNPYDQNRANEERLRKKAEKRLEGYRQKYGTTPREEWDEWDRRNEERTREIIGELDR